MKRDFFTLSDLGQDGVLQMLDRSLYFERMRGTADHPKPLAGKTAALIFEKPSTRTRISLEVGTVELGGHPLVLSVESSQIGRGEPIEDTARVLGRMVAAVTLRTTTMARLQALARACRAPVLNALTDCTHPMQVLADLHAVRGVRGTLDGLRAGWVGDPTNVARSWIEAVGLLKLEMVIACPAGMAPPASEIEAARKAGGTVTITTDPQEAARGADVLLTDTWVSMGQEADQDAKKRALATYRVTRDLVARASRDVIVLHCLPAHRGEEIDADVLDGPRSFVWDAVEARLHTSKALLDWVMAGSSLAGAQGSAPVSATGLGSGR